MKANPDTRAIFFHGTADRMVLEDWGRQVRLHELGPQTDGSSVRCFTKANAMTDA